MQAKVWATMNNLRAEEWAYLGQHLRPELCPQGMVLVRLKGWANNWRSREALERITAQIAIFDWAGNSVREM